MRTPPIGKNELSTVAGSTIMCENANQAIRCAKPAGEPQNSETTQNFNQLGSKIKELESMMSGQRHINQAMRDLVTNIVMLQGIPSIPHG